mmetsp:Transcript_43751/g.70043  ORF Transcript_43751/g.70043 Transcript_43751/m.70043 type:complete len:197 (+) Transcript_43751:1438-2028(+)
MYPSVALLATPTASTSFKLPRLRTSREHSNSTAASNCSRASSIPSDTSVTLILYFTLPTSAASLAVDHKCAHEDPDPTTQTDNLPPKTMQIRVQMLIDPRLTKKIFFLLFNKQSFNLYTGLATSTRALHEPTPGSRRSQSTDHATTRFDNNSFKTFLGFPSLAKQYRARGRQSSRPRQGAISKPFQEQLVYLWLSC